MVAGSSFDLTRVASITTAASKSRRRFLWALGLSMFALWGVLLVPSYVEHPRPLLVCSKGGCVWFPASGYWIVIALYTGVLVFLGSMFLVGAWLASRPNPTRVAVDGHGMQFTRPGGRTRLVRWPGWTDFRVFMDYSEAPRKMRAIHPPAAIFLGGVEVPLTAEALEAAIATARRLGLDVKSGRTDVTSSSEDPGFRIMWRVTGVRRRTPESSA